MSNGSNINSHCDPDARSMFPELRTMAFGRVSLTNSGPQMALTCFAADTYVSDMGNFRLAEADWNMPIVRSRHQLQAGIELPGREMLSGK